MLSENFTYDHSLTYLSSPDGIFAVAESTSNGYRLHYVHTDNLGSWDIITDMGGDLEQSLSFDAWGNRRNASTWNGSATDTPLFDRGFTGHEHLYNFGLINMNGRVYDPYMSTFLSPDNFIQAPDNSQNFNRYAYCLNNPLKYTDPSGEVFGLDDILLAAAVGAIVNISYQGLSGNIKSAGDFCIAMGIGALGGLAGLCIGSGISSAIAGTGFGAGFIGGGEVAASGFASGAVIGAGSGFSSGFITGSGNAWMTGSSFTGGLKIGITNGFFAGISGGLIGGMYGGIDAAMDGRNFWNGSERYVMERPYPSGEAYKQLEGSQDCLIMCTKSINHYRGGNASEQFLRNEYWIASTTDPVNLEQYLEMYCKGENAMLSFSKDKLKTARQFIDGADVIITKDQGESVVKHALLLRKVEYGIRNTWGSNAHPIVCGPIKLYCQDPQTGSLMTKAISGSFIKIFSIIKY